MSSSYEIQPKIRTVPVGTIFKAKCDLFGTNAAGVNKADSNFTFGDEQIHIQADSILTFVEDKQFIAAEEKKPLQSWIRFHFVVNGKIVWITMVEQPQRIWNFATFREKEKMLKTFIEENFEIVYTSNTNGATTK